MNVSSLQKPEKSRVHLCTHSGFSVLLSDFYLLSHDLDLTGLRSYHNKTLFARVMSHVCWYLQACVTDEGKNPHHMKQMKCTNT